MAPINSSWVECQRESVGVDRFTLISNWEMNVILFRVFRDFRGSLNGECTMSEIVFKEESYRIMGACFEVYKQMGCGFLEAVYQECLTMEFTDQRLPYRAQSPLDLSYKQRPLVQKYVPDFICFDSIIVELKAVHELTNEHRAQVHN